VKQFCLVLISLILIIQPVSADGPETVTWYNPHSPVTRSGYLYADINAPFLAVDDSQWEQMKHHPVTGSANGARFRAIVLDTGYLKGHCVMQPIVLRYNQKQPDIKCYPIALDMSAETYRGLGLAGLSAVLDWWVIDRASWWGML